MDGYVINFKELALRQGGLEGGKGNRRLKVTPGHTQQNII